MAVTTIQSMALSGQLQEPPYNLCRHGPENAAQYMLLSPATVRYSTVTSGAIYADTIPALTPARVYGKGPSINTVDTAAARYVLFIEPQYNGPAILWIAPEGYYNFICQQGFVIPLYYAWLHAWQVYQGTGGVATPPPGGSMSGGGRLGALDSHSVSGGGRLGALDSHSITGGGSVSGLAFNIGTNQRDGAGGSGLGLFVKVPALPATETVLADFFFGAGGYLTVSLLPSGVVRLHGVSSVFSCDIQLNATTPISLNQWTFISVSTTSFNIYNGGNQGPFYDTWARGVVTGAAGVVLGDQTYKVTSYYYAAYTALMGIGVNVSGGPGVAFPNTAGWALSKIVFDSWFGSEGKDERHNYVDTIAPPSVDWTNAHTVVYNCRDGLGGIAAGATLTDTCGNAHPLTPGAQGITVNVEGPYA